MNNRIQLGHSLTLQDNLLLYSHERMIGGVGNVQMAMESESSAEKFEKIHFDEATGSEAEAGKGYLLSLMFSHFDGNNNGVLDYDELHRVILPIIKGLARKYRSLGI